MHHTLHLIPRTKICVYVHVLSFHLLFLFSFSLQPFLKHSALFQIISLSLFSAVALFLPPLPPFFFHFLLLVYVLSTLVYCTLQLLSPLCFLLFPFLSFLAIYSNFLFMDPAVPLTTCIEVCRVFEDKGSLHHKVYIHKFKYYTPI